MNFRLGLCLIPVALPWLRFDAAPSAGVWLLNLLILAVYQVRERTLLRATSEVLTRPSLIWGSFCLLILGTIATSYFVIDPYYGLNSALAMFVGLSWGATGFLAFDIKKGDPHEQDERTLIRFAFVSVIVSLASLLLLPALFDSQAPFQFLDAVRTGSPDNIIRNGYIGLFAALESGPFDVPDGRGPNLRHEPALLLSAAVIALHAVRGQRTLQIVSWALLLLTLSRSAILAAVFGVLLLTVTSFSRGKRPEQLIFGLIGLTLISALMTTSLGTGLVDRFEGDGDQSASIRSSALIRTLEDFGTSVFGTSNAALGADFVPPHMHLLDATLGAGLLGLLSALVLLFFLGRSLFSATRRLRTELTAADVMIVALMAPALVRYFSAGSYLRSSISWFAVGAVLALSPSASRRIRRRSSSSAQQKSISPTHEIPVTTSQDG